MIFFAHRGASAYEPENTLRAVNKALHMGAEWIEIDVYPVEDQLIVIHDDTLERTTSGTGYVMHQSLKYLRSLDAGKGEKIPFLYEVFDTVGNRAGINIELKTPHTAGPVCALIDEYVSSHSRSYNRFLVSSVHHQEIHQVKTLQREIRIAPIIKPPFLKYDQLAKDLEIYSVHLNHMVINKTRVEKFHSNNHKVFVYTVNDKTRVKKLISLGVDGVFTNYPELMESV